MARWALDGLAWAATEHVATLGVDAQPWHDYLAIVSDDARRAGIAPALVLAAPEIGSTLAGNLNASLHLHSLLTDLLLVDAAFDTDAPSGHG